VIKAPPFGQGQRIGLFGGSFNPAHRGHVMVALYALKRLKLDWVWWLVSPQNPLKDPGIIGEYRQRLAETRSIAAHPRFKITDLEKQMRSHNTAATLDVLAPQLKRARFIWIMGADSFADLHRWHNWLDIPGTLPLAFLARPGYSIRALESRAALRFARQRLPTERAAALPGHKSPAWVFLPMPLRRESSTAIRALNATARSPKSRATSTRNKTTEKAR
jgi:nicotinate-nucleotide adenylyltransferase